MADPPREAVDDAPKEMLSLGPGRAWTEEIRRQYEGMTQAETRAELGTPARVLSTARNEAVDEYFIDNGFLDLHFKCDAATGNWVLAGCHLG